MPQNNAPCAGGRACSRRFEIYLNDHLALITGEIELLERCRRSNQGTALSELLGTSEREVREQRVTLLEVLRSVHATEDRLKETVAWFAEKIGRLKLNDSLVEYSPLSRLLELEALSAAAHERVALWEALEIVCAQDPLFLRLSWTQLRVQSQNHQQQWDEQRRLFVIDALN